MMYLLKFNNEIVDCLWFKSSTIKYKNKTLHIPLGGLFHEV